MNLIFSRSTEEDKLLSSLGHTFIGAGYLESDEIHVFLKQEKETVIVTREMAIDAGLTEIEGSKIKW